jgi:hypothetical protein
VRAIKQHVHGTLFSQGNHHALLLLNLEPPSKAPESLYLRYAFVRQGEEEPILPAFVLDDWGSEIRGLSLYEWVREYGYQFPRAELFGFDQDGQEAQCFLRELELSTGLLCYTYLVEDAPLRDGALIEALALPDESVPTAAKIKRPSDIPRPLRSAKAGWWLVNPEAVNSGLFFD